MVGEANMTPKETLLGLAQFAQGDHSVSVAVAARIPVPQPRGRKRREELTKTQDDKPKPESRQIVSRIERLQMRDALAQHFTKIVQDFGTSLESVDVHRYDASYRPEQHEAMYMKIADNHEIAGIVEAFSKFDDLGLFKESNEVTEHLKFYGVVVQTSRDKAVFFRQYSPKKELSRTKRFAVIHDKGAYDKISSKVFLFDAGIDCAAWGEYIFIFNVHQYHLMFQYYEALRRESHKTVATILKHVPIVNEDEFKAACDSFPMMVKLAGIASQPYLATLTLRTLERAIKRYHLGIDISSDAKGRRGLKFDPSPEKRWQILRLLGDGYLTSSMTNADYMVNSKTRLR